jgi:hypothetical protein
LARVEIQDSKVKIPSTSKAFDMSEGSPECRRFTYFGLILGKVRSIEEAGQAATKWILEDREAGLAIDTSQIDRPPCLIFTFSKSFPIKP